MLIPRHVLEDSNAYTRHMLNRLRQQSQAGQQSQTMPVAQEEDPVDNPLVRAFLLAPGMQRAVPLIQRAGMWQSLDQFVLAFLLLFLFAIFVLARFGWLGIPMAAIITAVLAWLYLRYRLDKRRRAFLMQFPEALDSIVRSVRAGYPLSSAIGMVAENMPAPLGPEFRRVVDEASFGFTLNEALNRMADRLDEPDVQFFTVVLSVQQEAGGNLSELLTNLASLIRKRKQLRLKIKALSSEGRATAWILGSLPLFVFLIISYFAPEHLKPLYNTDLGHLVLFTVVGMVGMGMLIVRQIIDMEI
ncbi:MAG: type II secretion system F family protein [Alphaproteobacteria bacterium]|nr:type II secretion system F family protein [Alphaproteobacteria bacterium]